VITYKDRLTPVQLGDRVETRIWLRKHRGRVVYVPDLSPLNAAMERDGLRWVGVRLEEGGFFGAVVDPDAHYLRSRLVLISRDADHVAELKADEDPYGNDSFAAP
jgi:hypothetical protein